MTTGISDVGRGDYVKTGPNRYEQIASVYGLDENGRPRKPSEGFFGVTTVEGRTVDGWHVLSYCKADELPEGAFVVAR